MTKKTRSIPDKELMQLGRDVQTLYESGYLSVKRLVWFSFIKGLAQGLGIFLGGTIIVAFIFWILGFFDQVPIIERLIDALRNPIPPS